MTPIPPQSVVKFIPFSSTVESPFWVRYCHLKLETIRLKEDPIGIQASYGVHVGSVSEKGPAGAGASANRIQCQESGLVLPEDSHEGPKGVTNDRVGCPGVLLGYNTKESFQKVDKNKLLKEIFCQRFFGNDKNLEAQSVVLLTFADLKQHKVLYWFGLPALMSKVPIPVAIHRGGEDSAWWSGLVEGLYQHRVREDALPAYFAVPAKAQTSEETAISITAPLNRFYRSNLNLPEEASNDEDVVFGFIDPTAIGTTTTTNENIVMMGWPMRNLIAYLVLHLGLGGKRIRILSLRPGGCPGLRGRISASIGDEKNSRLTGLDGEQLAQHSVLMTVALPNADDYDYGNKNSTNDANETTTFPNYKVVGWELNARQKPGPRWVNLKPLLDQNHLAIQAADLNLKLMKWRMIPELDVDMLQNNCKVLLLGAGTLGCSVARTLLGWGVRHFTFVDYGTVSYSNPVRQILFNLEDCHYDHGQGKPKAEAAASALKEIAADVFAEGIRLGIPMPGHASETTESLRETVEKLDVLIQEADVVFLLTDTRESRWLPTVMAAVHDKVLINAALGLDSWLVMRHGHGITKEDNGPRLGCYFCNDVVAPENSTKNRTLDQQCTVTRPGLAPIASSMAVELLISLLHHPQKQQAQAPARKNQSSDYAPTTSGSESGSPLGVLPHQIRGSIVTYTMMTPSVPAFSCCTGCSLPILEAYRADKFELVSGACASMDGSYLEDLAGLTAFRAEAAEKLEQLDALDWDDDGDDDEF